MEKEKKKYVYIVIILASWYYIFYNHRFIFTKIIPLKPLGEYWNYNIIPNDIYYTYFYGFILVTIIYLMFYRKLKSINSIDNDKNKGNIYLWYSLAVIISYLVLIINVGIGKSHPLYQKYYYDYLGKLWNGYRLYFLLFISLVDIFEEIIYRKIIFGTIYDFYKGTNKYLRFFTAFLPSAILFVAVHEAYVFNRVFYSFAIVSFIASLLYVKTKRISVPIVFHITYNIILFINR